MAGSFARWAGAFRRRRNWASTARDVRQRYREVHGGYLASAITLAFFVSLLPLLIATSAVLGFLAAGRLDFAARVVKELGLTGEAARVITDAIAVAEHSRQAATVLGLVGILLSGLGVVSWEIVTVMSTVARAGIGRAMLEEVRRLAQGSGATRLWLITTDDTEAAGFYEHLGMTRTRAHEDFVDVVRRVKPSTEGYRDAYEFEWQLRADG